MSEKPFHPPRYAETHEIVYDKRTGEIISQETRWSLRRPRTSSGRKTTAQRLSSLARQSKIPERRLAVLAAKPLRRGYRAIRIDVRNRKLIVDRFPIRRIGQRAAPFPTGP